MSDDSPTIGTTADPTLGLYAELKALVQDSNYDLIGSTCKSVLPKFMDDQVMFSYLTSLIQLTSSFKTFVEGKQ